MPFINVRLFEGRTPEQKRAFVEAVTREAARTLDCSPEAVDIVFEDVRKSDWATGGKFWSDPRPE
ncbi:MAG: 4-oxalocrotonate tautomerase [Betaproteobacteria bacterium]|nr:4-oxalocrotonate tautomerase [Betaproteobacteria bacterium]